MLRMQNGRIAHGRSWWRLSSKYIMDLIQRGSGQSQSRSDIGDTLGNAVALRSRSG